MSISFSIIEDSIVIIRHKFVYKQCAAYSRDGCVYVRAGGGFVKMRRDGTTHHPDIKWEAFEGFDASLERIAGDIDNYLRVDHAAK